jgi:pantothenate synthetase
MMMPTIHLNGTSREELIEQHVAAVAALNRALEAMARAAPHGRDYYPQGAGAIQQAIQEHNDRVARVSLVFAELTEIAEDLVLGEGQ